MNSRMDRHRDSIKFDQHTEERNEQSSNQPAKRGIWRIDDSDGPYCPLTTDGQRPQNFHALVHMSRGARLARHKQRAALDAEILRDMLDRLQKALASPSRSKKISEELLAQVVFLIREGLKGSIPVSWVPKGLEGEMSVSLRTRFTDARVRAAAHSLAVERGYIRDPTRQQTVVAATGKSGRTRRRWTSALRKTAEEELDAMLLQYPMLLYEEGGRSLRQLLLTKDGVTITVPEMS